ncbi:MAG: hypothetical protein K2M31_01720 [Muribaculaceae bacterium]|nr:hypothetical protein [Muribaculaceae bacterium]
MALSTITIFSSIKLFSDPLHCIVRNIAVAAGLSMLVGGLSFQVHAQDAYWHQRVSLFDRLPVGNDDIVFLGNSITDGGEFQELFEMDNVLNRGIRSDRINGVRKRLDQVTSGHPKKIFLLIGINDVADSRQTPSSLADMYEQLVRDIREKSPETTLYIQSVMPINNDFKRYKSLYGREEIIPALNEKLKDIADRNGAVYIDLWPALADPSSGKMKKQFTSDGLHLTGAGYRAWTDAVKEYLLEDAAPAQTEEAKPEDVQPVDSKSEQKHTISIVKGKG